jgi:hypothetical protein
VDSISNFRAIVAPKNAMCYTARMVKKITLKEIGDMLAHVVKHMATKEDLAEGLNSLRTELKGDILRVQTQVNSIESHIRGMNHVRLEGRVADLEDKVFGKAR